MMMKTLIRIFAAGLIAVAAFAAAAQQSVTVSDLGWDGDERYYIAYCPDGTEVALVQQRGSDRVCFSRFDGQSQCWDDPYEGGKAACGTR